MKITDLKTEESAQVGDTILSSRDLSLKYIDRTNTQFLNKIEYPKLWDLYKVSSGDRFIDKKFFDITSSTQKIDFIETENSYMVLQSPATVNLNFFNKNMNILSTKPSGLTSSSTFKKICGDNQYVIICDSGNSSNVKLHYSSNFNIDNQIVGTFTEKTMSSRTNIIFVNNHFIISQVYNEGTLYFKLNKINLSRISEFTGVFATDSLLDFVLINSVTFLSTNNLLLSKFSLTSNNIIFLENGEIYIYNNTDKKIVKTNQSNPYFLEIYENLSSEITTGDLVSFAYYKNSFIMSFKRLIGLGSLIFIINDNGQKIKQDSLINTNIVQINSNTINGAIFYIDFINKKIMTTGSDINAIVVYNNFEMNSKTNNVFNKTISNTVFLKISNTEFYPDGNNIYMNKNPVFINILTTITLENGSNIYDYFRADFIPGEVLDNFTMPAITGNVFDKYWTKKG